MEQDSKALVEEIKMDFDTWYMARKEQIPVQHYKEILLADFKGRKVQLMASTMAEFDLALKKYGVRL